MTDNATRRGRIGSTRARLILLAVLVLGLAGGAAASMLGRGETDGETAQTAVRKVAAPSATPRPTTPESTTPESITPGAATPAPSTGDSAAPRKQKSSAAPDSAARPDSVFVDPATAATTPRWDPGTPPTCKQWRGVLTDKQQTSYASALLTAAWKLDGSNGVPVKKTVRSYRSAMTAACVGKQAADDSVSDIARTLYTADPGTWGP